ncbi:hypothetical protein RugamoR57_37500 [Duganella caerulea]|uniref:hypothetical protein n=1 Tax=Duganella caerulea TaxID=2885762 RepID=UPI0030E9DFB1
MNQAAPQSQTPNRVPAIEQILDALCKAQPRRGEKIHEFVQRCCKLLAGKRERGQLKTAIMQTLAELGLKSTQPAALAQQVLNAVPETGVTA